MFSMAQVFLMLLVASFSLVGSIVAGWVLMVQEAIPDTKSSKRIGFLSVGGRARPAFWVHELLNHHSQLQSVRTKTKSLLLHQPIRYGNHENWQTPRANSTHMERLCFLATRRQTQHTLPITRQQQREEGLVTK